MQIKYKRTTILTVALRMNLQVLPKDDSSYAMLATGELVGFVNLEETVNQITQFQQAMHKKLIPLATHMVVLIVRGVEWNFQYPVAVFPTNKVHAVELSHLTESNQNSTNQSQPASSIHNL